MDYLLSKSGSTYYAQNIAGAFEFSGIDAEMVINAAIAATPNNGEVRFGPYEFLLNAPHEITNGFPFDYWVALPIGENKKNIALTGSGVGLTRLKLANGQDNATKSTLLILNAHTGPPYTEVSYTSFILANMTLDGNIANQPGHVYKDGAGLVLTGGHRSGCHFYNLELINSVGHGIYAGNNNGGHETGGLFEDIVARDCFADGMTFDNTENCIVRRMSMTRCGTKDQYYRSGISTTGNNDWVMRNDNLLVEDVTMVDCGLNLSRVARSRFNKINIRGTNCHVATNHCDNVEIHDLDIISDIMAMMPELETTNLRLYNPKIVANGAPALRATNAAGDMTVYGGTIKAVNSYVVWMDGTGSQVFNVQDCKLDYGAYEMLVKGGYTLNLLRCVGTGSVGAITITGTLNRADCFGLFPGKLLSYASSPAGIPAMISGVVFPSGAQTTAEAGQIVTIQAPTRIEG